MSVYIRKDSKNGTYTYEFQIRGRRFSGNTGKKSEREARQIEKAKKKEAELQLAEEASFSADDPTFEVAASKYWYEVGQYHTNSDNTLWTLDWLNNAIGRRTRLSKITDRTVAELVAKRRNELSQTGRKRAEYRLQRSIGR